MNNFTKIVLTAVTLAFLFETSDVLMNIDLCVHRYFAEDDADNASTKDLKQFTFTTTDFSSVQWTDYGKEFQWHNKRFDVTSIKHLQNKVIVLAHPDERENMLLGLLNNFHKNSQKNSVLLKSVKNYCVPHTTTYYAIALTSLETHFFLPSIHTAPVNFFSPPPNYC